MNGGTINTTRLLCSFPGARLQRCECCLRTAKQTVIVERASGHRVRIAACNRHRNMAERELRRFLIHRINRDRHFAEILALLAPRRAG